MAKNNNRAARKRRKKLRHEKKLSDSQGKGYALPKDFGKIAAILPPVTPDLAHIGFSILNESANHMLDDLCRKAIIFGKMEFYAGTIPENKLFIEPKAI